MKPKSLDLTAKIWQNIQAPKKKTHGENHREQITPTQKEQGDPRKNPILPNARISHISLTNKYNKMETLVQLNR